MQHVPRAIESRCLISYVFMFRREFNRHARNLESQTLSVSDHGGWPTVRGGRGERSALWQGVMIPVRVYGTVRSLHHCALSHFSPGTVAVRHSRSRARAVFLSIVIRSVSVW